MRVTLMSGARLIYDEVRGEHVLLVPEGMVRLNPSTAEVLTLCDGTRSLDEIIGVLAARYEACDLQDDVRELIAAMTEKGLVVDAAA